MHIHMYIHTHMHIHTYTHMHTCTYMRITYMLFTSWYMHVCTSTYVYTSTHAHMHNATNVYLRTTHTQMFSYMQRLYVNTCWKTRICARNERKSRSMRNHTRAHVERVTRENKTFFQRFARHAQCTTHTTRNASCTNVAYSTTHELHDCDSTHAHAKYMMQCALSIHSCKHIKRMFTNMHQMFNLSRFMRMHVTIRYYRCLHTRWISACCDDTRKHT